LVEQQRATLDWKSECLTLAHGTQPREGSAVARPPRFFILDNPLADSPQTGILGLDHRCRWSASARYARARSALIRASASHRRTPFSYLPPPDKCALHGSVKRTPSSSSGRDGTGGLLPLPRVKQVNGRYRRVKGWPRRILHRARCVGRWRGLAVRLRHAVSIAPRILLCGRCLLRVARHRWTAAWACEWLCRGRGGHKRTEELALRAEAFVNLEDS